MAAQRIDASGATTSDATSAIAVAMAAAETPKAYATELHRKDGR
jgi:hypothetical protein